MSAARATVRNETHRAAVAREEILLASRTLGAATRQTDLSVPGIHCGGCIRTIERALGALEGVERARVNLSTKRVAVQWRASDAPPPLIETLSALGYVAHLYDGGAEPKDRTRFELLRALAVSGFASSNIMLLSVAVWAGADGATRDLLHWISAAIAIPALAFSGTVFFRPAWRALRQGRTNMDVPISLGVLLAFGMSLYDTVHHGPHAYFDAATSLLFFLLIGRTLDHMMRERARVAVKGLARLAARGAMVAHADGTTEYVPVNEIAPGMTVLVGVGERVPVDAQVEEGRSDLDCSLVSGESMPRPVAVGSTLLAGTLNLTGPLRITATAPASGSFLAEMTRLMEAAEGGRSAYRRIADRAAQLYAPVVHLTALLTFAGWMIASGDLHRAVTIAIAVLIITCPCALGLAVPMVQVVAARRLFEAGIMVKDGGAMERLNEVDTVVFDKTGTLTRGTLRLVAANDHDPAQLAIAAAMAAYSRHPHSQALAAAARGPREPAFDWIEEHPGLGLEAVAGGAVYRLGRAAWAVRGATDGDLAQSDGGTVLSKDGRLIEAFQFEDQIREGARQAVAELSRQGFAMEILSGDQQRPVEALARDLDLAQFGAGVLPGEKTNRIATLAASGRKILMVGDGLNDAPALVAAHVSMAPATAADVGRNAADFVFLHESLAAVPLAIKIAQHADRLIRQNFAFAVAYNVITVPVAICGYVTPLVAALAMSMSSIIVVGNALRLKGGRPARLSQASASGPRVAMQAAEAPSLR
ncbi:cation-translocating P-type ATPase [Limobrevibacterium gyesilva]|uniref:Cation-translocating P-type ATPase n=1 Tax=Limobrevibacterium gyesilva TaxID=2991712 RepID=A0AA41YJG6_9PROT|nr:cation-translocating P-type ATPase [Limobrevibacterium gyesilva]MCW3473182.1 cation-translocating P-type ATPase [Limobrevibacterium gyesilva]